MYSDVFLQKQCWLFSKLLDIIQVVIAEYD